MRQFDKSVNAASTHNWRHNQKHGRNGPRSRIEQNRKRHSIGLHPADEQNSNAKNRNDLRCEALRRNNKNIKATTPSEKNAWL
ncbi:hypothetical protein [uncultured Planktomarina sp.]|jgi:hypothetical protein|uniref:hypothetical protein n=1 Tax=uncultured Planktomarina sp. TaxID=1538529 RepID=UPI003261B429